MTSTLLARAPQKSIARRHVAEPPHSPPPPQAQLLIAAVVEAMMGRRALHQLRPHLEIAAFGQLVSYVDEGEFRRITLGRVRAQMPTPTSVEASVHLARSARWLTCVIRLDLEGNSWRCNDLFVLLPNAA